MSGENVTVYSSGPFRIHYSPQALPVLQVMQDDRLVWFTSRTHSPLVSAEKVTSEVTQIGGDFTFNCKVSETCSEFEIKEVGTRPLKDDQVYATFFIRGLLCGDVAVEMTLQAVRVTRENSNKSHYHLVLEVAMAPGSRYNRLVLAYGCEKGEGFYGFGAQYSALNMKGKVLPLFLSEQGVGRGLQPVTFILDALSKGAGQLSPMSQEVYALCMQCTPMAHTNNKLPVKV